MTRSASNFVDFQSRAREFSEGDLAAPFGYSVDQAGRVTNVWPAVGMVDVEFATGNRRLPAEDLQKFTPDGDPDPPKTNSVTGPSSTKVALYWAQRDRKYRMSRPEIIDGCPCCPRCPDKPKLSRAIYKRLDGASERLLGCKSCLFLIKSSDIVNMGGGG